MQKKLLFLILCISLSGSVVAMEGTGGGEEDPNSKQGAPVQVELRENPKVGSIFSSLALLGKLQLKRSSSFLEGLYNGSLFGFAATLPVTIKKLNVTRVKESIGGLLGIFSLGVYFQRYSDVNEKKQKNKSSQEGKFARGFWNITRLGKVEDVYRNFLASDRSYKAGVATGFVGSTALALKLAGKI